jgi:DNA excision repair protein ERCC-2
MEQVMPHLHDTIPFYKEQSKLAKREKQIMLEDFSAEKHAVLLGVSSASFAEGIDLPGVFAAIIVVGIPLQQPDLETQELIAYYNARFSKGREYGYVYPAFTKTIQSAGRCIRNEKDRGVLVFLDERYAWPMYLKCFPNDWKLKLTKDYQTEIEKFCKA